MKVQRNQKKKPKHYDRYNNKFVFIGTPKTYEVRYVEQKEQQKPKLSLAAKQKVVNRNSNYLSSKATDLVPSYGPYFAESCNFSITATLVDKDGNSRTETISPTNWQEVSDLANRISLAGEGWRGDWNDRFNPSIGRGALAGAVRIASTNHGPQRITAVENPDRRDVSITANGNRIL